MIRTPTYLDRAHVGEVEQYLERFRSRLDQYVGELVATVEQEHVQTQLKTVAFTANHLLPKRNIRPAVRIEHTAEQIHLAHDKKREEAVDLIKFVLVSHEYYDIVDDIFDGDVAPGGEPQVFATKELLQPLLLDQLVALGGEAGSYWSSRSLRMTSSMLDELRTEPAAPEYRELMDKQAELYGAMTGLGALTADVKDREVERAETFGKNFFKFEQCVLDRKQYESGDPDPWNLWSLATERYATESLLDWQSEMETYLRTLPEEQRRLLRPLIALDVEAWIN